MFKKIKMWSWILFLFAAKCYVCLEIAITKPQEDIIAGTESWINCTVKDKPPGSETFATTWVLNGDQVTFRCDVRDPFKERYSFSYCDDSAQIFNLKIHSASCNDTGEWVCGFHPTAQNTTELDIIFNPKSIVIDAPDVPERAKVVIINATSNCISPNGSVSWMVDGDDIPESDFNVSFSNEGCDCNTYKTLSSLSYTMTSDESTIEETFKCTVDNGLGNVTEEKLSTFPTDVHIEQSKAEYSFSTVEIKLNCTSKCQYPLPIFEWSLEGNELPDSTNITFDIIEKCDSSNYKTYTNQLSTKANGEGVLEYKCTVSSAVLSIPSKSESYVVKIIFDTLEVWAIVLIVLLIVAVIVLISIGISCCCGWCRCCLCGGTCICCKKDCKVCEEKCKCCLFDCTLAKNKCCCRNSTA